jgi:hypothetical protein
MAGPANRCIREDGVTTGDIVFVTAYLSDAPVVSVQIVPTGGGEASGSLLSLTPEQALPVAAAVFGVWAIAWAAKQAIRTLRGSDEKID